MESPNPLFPELSFDPVALVRDAVVTTFDCDKPGRKAAVEALDATAWPEQVLMLLAATKRVLFERHRFTISRVGQAQWVDTSASEIIVRHQNWMKLHRPSLVAALRAGFGERHLADMMQESTLGRVDTVVVEALVAELVDGRDDFLEMLDMVFSESAELSRQPRFTATQQ